MKWLQNSCLYHFTNVSTVVIGKLSATDTRTYLLSCNGPCKNVSAQVKVKSGDLGLFSREDEPFLVKVINWHNGANSKLAGFFLYNSVHNNNFEG